VGSNLARSGEDIARVKGGWFWGRRTHLWIGPTARLPSRALADGTETPLTGLTNVFLQNRYEGENKILA